MVQLFFAWRVLVLTRSYVATGLLVLGATVSCRASSLGSEFDSSANPAIRLVGGIATSIAIGIVPEWEQFQRFEVPVIVWLTVSALVDTSITAIMVWHLVSITCLDLGHNDFADDCVQRKHKRGFKHSNDILDRIIRRECACLFACKAVVIFV